MASLKIAYYRLFQAVFNIGSRVLPWRRATVVTGADAIGKIPSLLLELGAKNPIVVTDPGLMAVGVAPKILQLLDEHGVSYALFSDVEPNPSVQTVEKIYSLYRENRCDGVIAIGGGSAMDAAKAAAARVVRPRKSTRQLGGLFRVLKKLPPFIAVPTTAGTGSETTVVAVITDTEAHYKYAIMDLSLIPRYAVLDPELTIGLPAGITATTGMDALTHAVEAYLCWTYSTKESLRFAEEAVEMIFQNLPKVYADGRDIEAREQMLLASFKAGFAFTRSAVGNVHAIAHTLSALYDTPHGLANAVLLPIVLEDYGVKVYPKLAKLAAIAGVKTGEGETADAKAFIAAIRKLNADMQIPEGFDFILGKDIPVMAKRAGKEANPLYPVPVVYDQARYTAVIQKAILKG